jgi:hypothetical protein
LIHVEVSAADTGDNAKNETTNVKTLKIFINFIFVVFSTKTKEKRECTVALFDKR